MLIHQLPSAINQIGWNEKLPDKFSYSKPEPDVAILKSRADFYSDSLSNTEDVLLLIEAADTSLRLDRQDAAVGGCAFARGSAPDEPRQPYSNPNSRARSAACVRSRAPIFERMLET